MVNWALASAACRKQTTNATAIRVNKPRRVKSTGAKDTSATFL